MGGLHSWNVEMHIAYKPSVWFDRWIGAFYGGFRRNLWISLCYVVFWSIWNQHNRVVFDNGATNWEKLLFLMKLILGFWMKSRCPECPPSKSLKWNVDGSARGKPGRACTGGVFHDDKGKQMRWNCSLLFLRSRESKPRDGLSSKGRIFDDRTGVVCFVN
ncbi:hypothetical protein MtrunA17_Chr1g0181561 [Medicago truncatula]|uniref:Uncharacterized protein n=1 Tax=Medicago truncatula TaxID=3880 RepID=A0A072VLH3_MEDTR|nr:hypothetical protein MTR_1g066780 [Medicago truncatula]RHN79827.1 hypothetical protein MtrunA17_Chr1g0181561 [Medicago truncatula]